MILKKTGNTQAMNYNISNLAFRNIFIFALKVSICTLPWLLWSCEKDDICVDGNTPHLIIRFYDKDDIELAKAVNNLRVIGEGMENPLGTVNRITTDSIAIPLQALTNSTTFSFISDSEDNEDEMEIGNTDSIRFDYLVEEVFVSRACGYIANYNDVTSMVINDGDNWIDSVEIRNQTVANEAAAHIIIFH